MEAERLAKLKADRKAEAQRLAKLKADRIAKEAARLKVEADARAKADAAAQRKAEDERIAKIEADRKVKEAARLKAEAEARAKAEEDARLKAETERLAKLEADRKAEEERANAEALLAATNAESATIPETANIKIAMNPFGLTELGHRVRNGQTLAHVSELYGVEAGDIIRWNGLDSSIIGPGDELKIYLSPTYARKFLERPPNDEPEPEEIVHVVGRGENLTLIAKMFDTTVRDLALWNQLTDSHLEPGQKLTLFVPPIAETDQAAYAIHRVARGDTLTLIAVRYKTNNTKLIQLNNLKNANHIWIGQRLKVPIR